MAEDLFVRLVNDERVEWLVLDEGSGIVRFRGHGDWSDLEAMGREMDWNGRTHVIAPAETVLLTRATVPSKQMRQVLQAVPFMVEESLASDVDDCHFAIGDRLPGGAVSVAVIDRDRLSFWLERLRAADVPPSTITTEIDHVRQPASGVRVMVLDEGALIVGEESRLLVDLPALPTALSLAGDLDGIEIQVPDGDADAVSMYTTQIEAEQGTVNVVELDYSPFEQMCRDFSASAINLLQGEFKVEEKRRERRNPWPAVATLAACAFGLHIMLLIVQGVYMDVKATQYESEARALYADVFPNDRNVRDLRRRWQSRIRAGSGQGGDEFIDVFAEAARQIPGSNLRLENVNFNESRGDVSLQLVAGQSSEFVRFSRMLSESGLDAEVGTISQIDDGARGNIRIRMTP